MKTVNLSPEDLKKVNKIKKELLTDKNASPSSNSRNHKELGLIAMKYKVDIQVVYDAATWKNELQ